MFYKILLFIAFSGVFSNRSIIQIISSQESTSKIPPLQQKNKLPTIYSDDYINYKDFTFELFACVQNDSDYEKHSKNTYRLHNVAIKKIVPEYSCHHIYAEVMICIMTMGTYYQQNMFAFLNWSEWMSDVQSKIK
jgi:hypothetical protein